jgi:hypothetical protein
MNFKIIDFFYVDLKIRIRIKLYLNLFINMSNNTLLIDTEYIENFKRNIIQTENLDIDIDDDETYHDGLDEKEETLITIKIIQSNNEYQFIVLKEVLLLSEYFVSLFEIDNSNKIEFKELIDINTFKIILKFLLISYVRNQIQQPMTTNISTRRLFELSEMFNSWEISFINSIDKLGFLNETVKLANYFDIKTLLYLTTAKIAIIIRKLSRDVSIKVSNESIHLLPDNINKTFEIVVNELLIEEINNYFKNNVNEISFNDI